jgi:hypothetical protein
MRYSEDRPDAQPSRPDVYLLGKDLRYSRRRSQKTVRTLDSQSLNLSRFRFYVSLYIEGSSLVNCMNFVSNFIVLREGV